MTISCHTPLASTDGPFRIPVHLGDRSYEIVGEAGLLDQIARHLTPFGMSATAVIVTNSTVKRLYASRVLRSLKVAGISAAVMTVPEGERAKSMTSLNTMLNELVRRRYERTTWLIALGGGVVGDVAGFAAATYLRGIPFVQVPTTLVAQVDASIGGKTGINHRLGKNLIGSFYQPKLVLIDPSVLRTLPPREYRAGLAEVIKYGVIEDAGFFEFLEQNMAGIVSHEPACIDQILRASCAIKADVVSADEREGDRRRILNFGHTVGHALETVSGYRRYKHGEAVAIGMVVAAGVATRMGLADPRIPQRIRAVVEAAGLSAAFPRYSPAALIRAMRQDKKVQDQAIHFVLPTEIGKVVVRPVDPAVIREVLAAEQRPDDRPMKAQRA
jgi:3-dehydroquinate synthase